MHLARNVLVTELTSGIGLSIAPELASHGMNLMLDRVGDAAEIEALRSRPDKAHRVDVLCDGADMSRQDAIQAMRARAADRFGGIDILAKNAGIIKYAWRPGARSLDRSRPPVHGLARQCANGGLATGPNGRRAALHRRLVPPYGRVLHDDLTT